jgi:hypothetical protein
MSNRWFWRIAKEWSWLLYDRGCREQHEVCRRSMACGKPTLATHAFLWCPPIELQ